MTTNSSDATTGYDYTVTRVVDAPAEKVWQVWTEDAHYEKWFHAVPQSVALDVRPGGAWRATMVSPDGGQFPMTGTYREVVANRRLVTAMDTPAGPALMEMRLTDVDGKTEVTLAQTLTSAQERDQAKEGSEILLEWCAEYLGSI